MAEKINFKIFDKWDISEIEVKDPGLKRVKPGEIPQVVVHHMIRPTSFFTSGSQLPFADEVECLMDLHEARMEPQAFELLEHLKYRESV